MSQTVLGALWRRVGALLQATPPGGHATETDQSSAAALVTDGGERSDRDDEHLRDVPDGAGCTEIWEHLSERQAADVEVDAEVRCDD